MDINLTENEISILLSFAREALEEGVKVGKIKRIDLTHLPSHIIELGASFVTLTNKGSLRGCIGTLEPHQPLVEDVREHAVAAALHDYRFPPVRPVELSDIKIEISRLTPMVPLVYENPEELPNFIQPQIDGVVLRDGPRRSTFLPQVWLKIPNPVDFLDQLCIKMGTPAGYWRSKRLQVYTYQVEEFHEK
jgi:AmmeMemoRadiSam system protein A